MRSIRALSLAGLLAACATGSLAQPPAAADAPMATASGSPQTADQIRAFIDSSPAAEARRDPRALDDDLPLPDRQVHGEVSVGVGNHGYRSAYARSDIPVGKTGTVSIAVGEERGRSYGYGYPYGGYGRGSRQSLGLGFDWSGRAPEGAACLGARGLDATDAERRRCEAAMADRAD